MSSLCATVTSLLDGQLEMKTQMSLMQRKPTHVNTAYVTDEATTARCEPPPCEASGYRPEELSPRSSNTVDSSPTLAKMPITPMLPRPLLSHPSPMSPMPWSSTLQVSPRPPPPSWTTRPPPPPISRLAVTRATDSETLVNEAAGECAARSSAAGATSHTEAWTTVTHGNSTRPRDARSTAAMHTLRGIAPARRKAEFFLSRLDPLTTVEDILSHVKVSLKSNEVQCERLQTRYNSYASFRVTVDNRFYKRMVNADMWPEYVVFRRYFPPRNQ